MLGALAVATPAQGRLTSIEAHAPPVPASTPAAIQARASPSPQQLAPSKPKAAPAAGFWQMKSVLRLRQVLAHWLSPLQASAVVTTVFLQLSPLRSVLEIRKAHDVKRYDGYPYFTVLAGATQWCVYGVSASIATGDHTFYTMVAANGPGIFFGIFYITTFTTFLPRGDQRGKALQSYLMFGAGLLFIQAAALEWLRGRAVFWLGLLGAIGSAQIACSPFKTLPEVVRTRSTKSWPVDMCIWSFIQSLCTGGFGFAIGDPWIFLPNVIGVIAAGFQLVLVAAFNNSGAGNEDKELVSTTPCYGIHNGASKDTLL